MTGSRRQRTRLAVARAQSAGEAVLSTELLFTSEECSSLSANRPPADWEGLGGCEQTAWTALSSNQHGFADGLSSAKRSVYCICLSLYPTLQEQPREVTSPSGHVACVCPSWRGHFWLVIRETFLGVCEIACKSLVFSSYRTCPFNIFNVFLTFTKCPASSGQS